MNIWKKKRQVLKMVKVKLIKDADRFKKGEVIDYSKSSAKDMIECEAGIYLDDFNKTLMEEFITKCANHNTNLWAKERGYDPKVLQELNIGICKPEVYSEMLQEFGREELEKQGLIKSGKHKFVNRIIIPYNANYFLLEHLTKILYQKIYLLQDKRNNFILSKEKRIDVLFMKVKQVLLQVSISIQKISIVQLVELVVMHYLFN